MSAHFLRINTEHRKLDNLQIAKGYLRAAQQQVSLLGRFPSGNYCLMSRAERTKIVLALIEAAIAKIETTATAPAPATATATATATAREIEN